MKRNGRLEMKFLFRTLSLNIESIWPKNNSTDSRVEGKGYTIQHRRNISENLPINVVL